MPKIFGKYHLAEAAKRILHAVLIFMPREWLKRQFHVHDVSEASKLISCHNNFQFQPVLSLPENDPLELDLGGLSPSVP